MNIVRWCSLCCANQADKVVEAEINGVWEEIDVCQDCLTKAAEAGKLEE